MRRGKARRRPIRVVHVCDLQAGGISSMILAVCEGLDREKVNFDYLVYRDQQEFDEWRIAPLGGKKLVANSANTSNKISKFLMKFFNTYQVLKKEKSTIIHINASDPYDCMAGFAARLAGVKTVVLHSHSSRLRKNGIAYRVFQMFFRMCIPICGDWYFACSDLAGEFMYGKHFRHEITWIKNGINTHRFRFDESVRQEMRAQYQLQDTLVVGTIGRICPEKNHSFMLRIFAELHRLRPDARFILVGQGVLEEQILAQVEELGLGDYFLHVPATNQAERFYCMMDVFLLPSLYEGLPVVGIEAQNSGLPCIFSDSITRNLAITDRAHYLSLDQSPVEWAKLTDILARETTVDRSIYADRVREAGFEIKDTAAWLQEFYLSL